MNLRIKKPCFSIKKTIQAQKQYPKSNKIRSTTKTQLTKELRVIPSGKIIDVANNHLELATTFKCQTGMHLTYILFIFSKDG